MWSSFVFSCVTEVDHDILFRPAYFQCQLLYNYIDCWFKFLVLVSEKFSRENFCLWILEEEQTEQDSVQPFYHPSFPLLKIYQPSLTITPWTYPALFLSLFSFITYCSCHLFPLCRLPPFSVLSSNDFLISSHPYLSPSNPNSLQLALPLIFECHDPPVHIHELVLALETLKVWKMCFQSRFYLELGTYSYTIKLSAINVVNRDF